MISDVELIALTSSGEQLKKKINFVPANQNP